MTMSIQSGRTAKGRPAFAHLKHELLIVDGQSQNASYDGNTVQNLSLQIPRIAAWGDTIGAAIAAPGATTATLNAHHLFADDALIGYIFSITDGTNTEHKIITDNALSGRTITFGALTNAYAITSTYKLQQRYTLTAVDGAGSLQEADYQVLVACVDKSRIMRKVSSTCEIPENNDYSDQEWYKVTITAGTDTIRISNLFKPTDTTATHYRIYCTEADGTEYHELKDVAIDDPWDGTQTIDIDESETFIAAQPIRHMKHHRIPPVSVVVPSKNTVFMGGTVTREGPGTITMTSGSRNFTGTGTSWTSADQGLFIRAAGKSALYEIRTIIDTTHGIFYEKATEAYTGASFELVGRNDTLWQTEVDRYTTQAHPEGTDLYNRAVEVPVKHGDGIVGGTIMPGGKPLVLTQSGGIELIPGTYVDQRELFEVGLISKNGVVAADTFVAFLNQMHGIYAATGTGGAKTLTPKIRKLLSDDKINRAVLSDVPSMFFSEEGGTRWAVWAFAPADETTHTWLFLLNVDLAEWSVIKGPAVTAMGLITDSDGIRRPVVGDCFGRLWWLFKEISSTNTSMGSQTSRRRGIASAATSTTLTDSSNTFYTTHSGELGVPIAIIAGTGSGQERLVYSNTATVITVHKAWTTTPDTTSIYQLGASRCRVRRPPWSFGAGPGALKRLKSIVYTVKACTPVYDTGKVHVTYGSATANAIGSASFPTDGTATAQPLFVDGDNENMGWISSATASALTLTSAWTGKTGTYEYSIGSKFLKVDMFKDLDDPDSATAWKTVYVPMDNEVTHVDTGVQGNYIQLEETCWDEGPVEIWNCEPVYALGGFDE